MEAEDGYRNRSTGRRRGRGDGRTRCGAGACGPFRARSRAGGRRLAAGADGSRRGTAGPRDPLDKLAQAFFAEAHALTETPWGNAVIPDFVYPDTRGERPPGLEQFLAYGAALTKLGARDPAVHRLVAEMQHLLKPRSAYQDPALVASVLAVMAEA